MNVFKNLYNYRELLKTSVRKEVRGKYKNSILGVLWSFLNPLLQIAVYALVFPLIMRSNESNYTVFICCGLIPWNFFSTAIIRSSSTMIENNNILKKVFFPREILPISIVTSEMVNFVISTLIILGFVLFYGLGITKFVIFYPLILLVQYILLLGFSFIVSSITVYVRDLQHFIGVFLSLLFYATPIAYSSDLIPQKYSWIIKFNPMTYVIDAFRDIFYYQTFPDIRALLGVLIFGCSLSIIGYVIFDCLQRGFAEEL